jgi:sarcosine oxidase subunit delta
MRISCPHCGARPHDEFVYYGDARMQRPNAAADGAEPAYFEYVYLRDNPAGPHRELWFHQGGCHEWLVVERDTRTHAIHGVTAARAHYGQGESQ